MEQSSNHHEIQNVEPSLNKMDGIAHPLQDVYLEPSENIRKSPEIVTKKVQKNWVKFDDEVDGEVTRTTNNSSNNNNNFINTPHDIAETSRSLAEATNLASAPATEPSLAVTTTSTIKKLSPPPPPRTKSNAATATNSATIQTPTTVTNTDMSGTPGEKIVNIHSAAVAPVQRSAISSAIAETEVPPAVLATESTHVNLNSSSKSQHQQLWQQSKSPPKSQSLQQQHQHQQQQQSIPKSSSNILTGSDSPPHAASAPAATGSASVAHGRQHSNNNGVSASKAQSAVIPVESAPPMRTIELSTGRIREGFANGDVIVTLLPANTKWPWITPAIFRPELVPEELMAQGLTLTVEDYVHAMETLVNDYRFTVYNVCYKRILVCWILFAFTVLLTLLFSGLQGVALFSLGVAWLFLNAAAIFLCMWVKLRLARGLEKCLARVNKQLMRHKILLVLDDRGRISCHKVNLCFLYFDATQCVNFLNEFLEHTEQNGGEAIKAGWEAKLDLDLNDIVIQGNNPVRLSRKQAVAQEIFLSYLQRWGKDFLRRRLDWTVQEAGVHETPRHLQSSICPCQYEEDLLRNKVKSYLQRKQCCGINCLACWL